MRAFRWRYCSQGSPTKKIAAQSATAAGMIRREVRPSGRRCPKDTRRMGTTVTTRRTQNCQSDHPNPVSFAAKSFQIQIPVAVTAATVIACFTEIRRASSIAAWEGRSGPAGQGPDRGAAGAVEPGLWGSRGVVLGMGRSPLANVRHVWIHPNRSVLGGTAQTGILGTG